METVEIEMPADVHDRIRDMGEYYGLWESEMVKWMLIQYLLNDPHGLVEEIDIDEDGLTQHLSDLADRRERRLLAATLENE